MELYHGGPGSGRYELGSGKRPYQHRGNAFRVSFKNKASEVKASAKKIGSNFVKKDIKTGKGRDDITRGEKLSRNVQDAANETNDLRKSIKALKNKKKMTEYESQQRAKVRKMTDSELQKEINRMSLEKRYMDLSRDKVNSGRDYVDDVFDGINSAALLTGSIVGTIALIRSLRK